MFLDDLEPLEKSFYRPKNQYSRLEQILALTELAAPATWTAATWAYKKVNPMRKKARIRKIRVPNWLTYDFPPTVKAKVNRLWGGEWQGQQKLTKDESEVNLATSEAKPKFAEWKWARPEEVIEQWITKGQHMKKL
ncbi:hypothetical protein UlMin_017749 [Ulmus minor]